MDMKKADILSSLTNTLQNLRGELGSSHPAVKAVEEQITRLSAVENTASEPEKCNCAGCTIVEFLTTGVLPEGVEPIDLLRGLFEETDKNPREYLGRLESAMDDAKRIILEKGDEKARMTGLMTGIAMLAATFEFTSDPEMKKIFESFDKKRANAGEPQVPPELLAALREAGVAGKQVHIVGVNSPEDMEKIIAQLGAEGATRH